MKVSKPRVVIEGVDSTFVMLKWGLIKNARYQIDVALAERPTEIIETNYTTKGSFTVSGLTPETNYSLSVTCKVMIYESKATILHVKTETSVLLVNLGSGDRLYPNELSNTYNLKRNRLGYAFNTDNPALYCEGHWYQFATFSLGDLGWSPHLNLQISGENWCLNERHCISAKTQFFLKIRDVTGWLDCNKKRIAGIMDYVDGARVFEKWIGNNTFRITLTSLQTQFTNSECLVRIGLPDDERTISKVENVEDERS